MIVRQKWHVDCRNLCKGDVVLVQDTNAIRGLWKLAQVEEAVVGKDGRVRDVVIRLKNLDVTKAYEGKQDTLLKRSIHRLVLILPVEEQRKN